MKKFERVILIDDDELTLMYNELILEQAGNKSEVISIATSAEASLLYKESVLENTLILVDMNLENENALELLETLNALPNYEPVKQVVVILSSAVLLDFIEISKSFPEVKKHLEKPLVLEALNQL